MNRRDGVRGEFCLMITILKRAVAVLVAILGVGAGAWAATGPLDVELPYLGWGGPGSQVFRSAISVAHNHPSKERAMIVIVDDLFPRGPRPGIARVEVEYEEPSREFQGRPRRFSYVTQVMYKAAPLSPRMARFVIPQGDGVIITMRFFRTARSTMDRAQDPGYLPDLDRTIPAAQLMGLPFVHVLKDPAIRRPRGEPTAAPSGIFTQRLWAVRSGEGPRRTAARPGEKVPGVVDLQWKPSGQQAPAVTVTDSATPAPRPSDGPVITTKNSTGPTRELYVPPQVSAALEELRNGSAGDEDARAQARARQRVSQMRGGNAAPVVDGDAEESAAPERFVEQPETPKEIEARNKAIARMRAMGLTPRDDQD